MVLIEHFVGYNKNKKNTNIKKTDQTYLELIALVCC